MAKLRHELKHEITPVDAQLIRARLQAAALPDQFADASGGYCVNSLYFDTPSDRALREKLDGVDPRSKFRIRYYNDDHSFIRLEKKSKVHGLCAKRQTSMTRAQCDLLLEGSDAWYAPGDEILDELHAAWQSEALRPREIVAYRREAFVYPAGNVRITLDYDLRRCIQPARFFELSQELQPVHSGIILEVKYDEFLPQFLCDLVRVPNRRATAFSKYAACRGAI